MPSADEAVAVMAKTVPFMDYVAILVHRAMAGHGPNQECPECPYTVCRHCGDFGPVGNDHTCPCPNGDDCPDHPSTSTDQGS